MKTLDICKSYFYGFHEILNYKKNNSRTNILAVLKICSYFTGVIALGFATVYAITSLLGRVSKTQNLSSHDKNIQDKAKEVIGIKVESIDTTAQSKPLVKSIAKEQFLDNENVQDEEEKVISNKVESIENKITPPTRNLLSEITENVNRPLHLGDGKATRKAKLEQTLKKEIDKFSEFLKNPSVGSNDIVYVCIGAGDVLDQVWPGFIFESLEKKQRVKTIVFEELYVDITQGASKKDIYNQVKNLYRTHYKDSPSQNHEEASILTELEKNYEFHQFLCGYPGHMESSVDTSDPKMYEIISNVYWPTKTQLIEAKNAFEKYIREEIKKGKTIVLGDHTGNLDANSIKFYNELVNEFPGKVHFFWAYAGANLMTSKPLKEEDCKIEKREYPWVYYENLRDCRIGSLDNTL